MSPCHMCAIGEFVNMIVHTKRIMLWIYPFPQPNFHLLKFGVTLSFMYIIISVVELGI